jgi:predicted DNA-binding protein YlxM (UPF0122 family)
MSNTKKMIDDTVLLDFYGELLTDKQKTIMEYYYNDDYTLTEISEILNISRQAIYDTVKRTNELLNVYENKLHLASDYYDKENKIDIIEEELKQIKETIAYDNVKNILNYVDNLINRLNELRY